MVLVIVMILIIVIRIVSLGVRPEQFARCKALGRGSHHIPAFGSDHANQV